MLLGLTASDVRVETTSADRMFDSVSVYAGQGPITSEISCEGYGDWPSGELFLMSWILMGLWWRGILVLAFLSWSDVARAQDIDTSYSSQIFWEDATTIKWETTAVFVGVTAIGLKNWNWGSRNSFKTNPEGWFGPITSSGGTDKLGHAFASYAMTNVLTERLIVQGRDSAQAALTSALITQSIMLYVEVFDGYSVDHGWSYEDVVMNLLGSGFAYARHANPSLRNLVDFRLEYQPSGYNGFRPISDYPGQKYLLAFKLSGLDALRNTSLRFLELQAGYYARGFSKAEQAEGLKPQRYSFVGIGLNLSELLFGQRNEDDPGLRRAGQVFFEHVQIPNTAVRTTRQF